MTERQPAAFGGAEFDVTSVRDEVRRSLEINRYPNRDGADVLDRGALERRTTCDIVFYPRPPIKGEQIESGLDHLERFRLFFIEANSGRAREFAHPHGGGYNARIEAVEWQVDYTSFDEMIEGRVVFVEDSTSPSPFVTGSARPRSSGIAAVEIAIDDARFEIAAVDSSADLSFLDTIETGIAQWQTAPDLLLDITSQLGRITRLIETTRETLDLTSDIDNFQAFIALERVANAVREAAEAVRQQQPVFRETTVRADVPLRRFVVATYGAEDAAQRFDEILAVNDIRDPGYVKAGTVLLIPAAGVSQQTVLRSAHR